MNEELFVLTDKQQKAFNNLKKAFKKCEGIGLMFYNNYGFLGVTDRSKISEYNDEPSDLKDGSNASNPNELRLPCNEWADDTHYFHKPK
jgi:hypothetical protein